MRIRVLANYGGAMTNEARIEPGEYDFDAPELFGAGQYLLDNGHAVALESVPEEKPEPITGDTFNESVLPVPLPKKPTPQDRRRK